MSDDGTAKIEIGVGRSPGWARTTHREAWVRTEHSAHFEHSSLFAFILYFYAEILVSYFKVRSGFRRNCDLNRAR